MPRPMLSVEELRTTAWMRLWRRINETVRIGEKRKAEPRGDFPRRSRGLADAGEWAEAPLPSRATIPYLTEPWYC